MDDIIIDMKSLKESLEKSILDSRRCDTLLKVLLTSEEIEELSNLRKKQEENIKKMIDIMNFVIYGYSDKLEEYPDIKLITLEMIARHKIVTSTEEDIMKIYATVKSRLM